MADKKLERVRTKFVEKVSKELINQLLDDLLDDAVLNDGEKDSVLEDNTSRADKARSLIDTVRRKGDNASRKMIVRLETRDPTLCSELGLSGGQAAESGERPAAEPPRQQEWSTKLIPTTEAFWREKLKDTDIYRVTKESMRKRVALLITNIEFTWISKRKGAEKDEKNMEKLLSDLDYEVVKHTNLTGKEIDDALIDFSKHPKLKETDSVMVVIMSHGKLGAILGVNWKKETSDDEKPDEFPINNIYKHLGSENCPVLLNKPKIIIIQACRGEGRGSVLISDQTVACDDPAAVEDDIEEDDVRCVHQEKDFIALCSCTPDTVSYRSPILGSFLIQYIDEVFKTLAHEKDIEVLFRKVMQRFEDFPVPNRKQMATKERVTLTKSFYLFPGLNK